ncbi:MAG: hypothetical protein WAS24_07820 [Thermoplasmata archaeon]
MSIDRTLSIQWRIIVPNSFGRRDEVIPLLAILACQRWLDVIETPKGGKWSLARKSP